MSIASPQNRSEFKQYILTKLGAPVLQINVSDEQLDLCINDAFQYFHEREHFNGTERVYLGVKVTEEFEKLFKSSELQNVTQLGEPTVSLPGMVSKLQLVSPGSGYPPTESSPVGVNQPTTLYTGPIVLPPVAGPQAGIGSGLTVNWGIARTTSQGILDCEIADCGKDYVVGEQVVLTGGNGDCIFQVTETKTSSEVYGSAVWEQQRNFILMPEDVLGVYHILSANSGYAAGAGVVPGAFFTNPFLSGAAGAGNCSPMGFDLVSYYSFKQWMADLQFMFKPEIPYEFNQRTHRLFVNATNEIKVGRYLVMECAMRPSPDVFPDLWQDRWLKRYSTALAKKAWGQNLTKYQQVQLPGGITLNGDMIYNEGKEEIRLLEERFSMDEASMPMDLVG
jgi:hypothetical protein